MFKSVTLQNGVAVVLASELYACYDAERHLMGCFDQPLYSFSRKLQVIRVNGTSIPTRQEILSKLKNGDEIKLFAEPENPVDKNAIVVKCGNYTLGYVPKEINVDMAKYIGAKGILMVSGGYNGFKYGAKVKFVMKEDK